MIIHIKINKMKLTERKLTDNNKITKKYYQKKLKLLHRTSYIPTIITKNYKSTHYEAIHVT